MNSKLREAISRFRKKQGAGNQESFDFTTRTIETLISGLEEFIVEKANKILGNIAKRVDLEIKTLSKRMYKGDKGDKGDPPTKAELISIVKPLIPEIKNGKTPSKEELTALIKPLIPKIPKVKNGETPSDERLIGLIKSLIPKVKDGSPDTAEDIAKKLNTKKEIVEMSVIKGLEKYLENIIRSFREKTTTQASGGGNIVEYYDLSGQLNGVTKTFTIPRCRKVIGLWSSQFPVIYRPTTDYTYTQTSITLTDEVGAPEEGQTLTVLYAK